LGIKDGPQPIAVIMATLQLDVLQVSPLFRMPLVPVRTVPLPVARFEFTKTGALGALCKRHPFPDHHVPQHQTVSPSAAELGPADKASAHWHGPYLTEQVVSGAEVARVFPFVHAYAGWLTGPRDAQAFLHVLDKCGVRNGPSTPRQNDLVVVGQNASHLGLLL
jgi:hypothetical protein